MQQDQSTVVTVHHTYKITKCTPYTRWAKSVSLIIIAMSSSTVNQLS